MFVFFVFDFKNTLDKLAKNEEILHMFVQHTDEAKVSIFKNWAIDTGI